MIRWLLHVLGVEPRQTSTAYNFWSGFGSDMTEFAALGLVWHLLNCHEQSCMRIARFTTVNEKGAHVRHCKKHHLLYHRS